MREYFALSLMESLQQRNNRVWDQFFYITNGVRLTISNSFFIFISAFSFLSPELVSNIKLSLLPDDNKTITFTLHNKILLTLKILQCTQRVNVVRTVLASIQRISCGARRNVKKLFSSFTIALHYKLLLSACDAARCFM